MKKLLVTSLFAIAGGLLFLRTAMAFDVNAGPIWNNADAQNKCPAVCNGLQWNGQWTTTVPNQMSVCGTVQGVDVPVGPIWNNDDAQTKCPSQISRVTWSGQWTTTVWGQMSVCGCTPPPPAS
ncbi:mannan-binding protein [Polyangium sorediatum]|uniref:Mannan-binding lectin n=1 Tax=Polyangium sorediatum TaxID=889274 RepID=A0ABT6NKJ7_9BACT|nr:mannan-binding protein [Polyangium sorediatum]MDI1428835.1 mannan-binding lectin [Polyangium sorediatum]